MPKKSAGLLMYRMRDRMPEVFLVHPGGPFWRNRDLESWSIPKGEYDDSETPIDAARREFMQETGCTCSGPFTLLGTLKQPGGKMVTAWSFEGDCAAEAIVSNHFSLEWPPKSGRMQSFPEVDRAEWFGCVEARLRIHKGQRGFIDMLEEKLTGEPA